MQDTSPPARAPATPTPDPAARCPVCGRANTCAMAAGLPPRDCWCMDVQVPPQALARIPPGQRDRACLCPACAAGLPPPRASRPGSAPI
ncbi:cysteine-rich CWC family protein [Paracidovorax konjaci]|uniref:Cysteine-rich CWC n=1 Tax=Paracidovorax konjaci TaxID=32040 RepID=A0A1I1Z172_9BURK|nr:cysteine-rich CWC family protein [Paracidovorax konjaci]SFE25565.1 Cysteine-rich CWC [Paracidovorax konjaci]